MEDAWSRGAREVSHRSPLQSGEHRGPEDHRGERRDRHIRLGVSHPSDDPAQHRVFEVRAAYDGAAGGWVARVGEQNANAQLDDWGPPHDDEGGLRAFPTPAACLGDAVTALVALVDRETEDQSGSARGGQPAFGATEAAADAHPPESPPSSERRTARPRHPRPR